MQKESRYNLFPIHDVFTSTFIVIPPFDSFIPVIMLNTLRFSSSVSFGTHTLLDKALRALQLPTHLPNLTANGC